MRKIVIVLIVMAATALAANAQTVVGSKHDLRALGGGTAAGTGLTEVCVVCHTPHQTSAASTQDPLWNRNLSATANYGVYASNTLNASPVPADLGGATLGSANASQLCLSCHDGTVSVLSMYNNPPGGTPTVNAIASRIDATGKIISSANVGTSLGDDHPVNFTYNTALATSDGGLKDPAVTPAVSALLRSDKVQCVSCHEVHDPTNTPFLQVSNAASALCTTCHNK